MKFFSFLFIIFILLLAGYFFLDFDKKVPQPIPEPQILSEPINPPATAPAPEPLATPQPVPVAPEPQIPVEQPIIEPVIEPTCTDTCQTDSCNGKKFVACITGDDGCKTPVDKRYVKGKCNVDCLSEDDCNPYFICKSYSCNLPEPSCGDSTCSITEFGACIQDCGELTYPYLAAYPAVLFTNEGNVRDNLYFVHDGKPYQQEAIDLLVDKVSHIDPSLTSRIVSIDELQNVQNHILLVFGNECDNDYYATIGRTCSPFSGTSPSLQVMGGNNFKFFIYGNEQTLSRSVQTLLDADENDLKQHTYIVP